jgi:hypothetical protein
LKLALWQGSNEASAYRAFSLMRLELNAASEIEAHQAAKKARQELTEAGLNDDVDEALCPLDGEDDEALISAADFQAVREFYEAPVVRREGTEPVTSTVGSRRRSKVDLGNAGASAISAAVRQSGAATSTASGT